MGAQVGQENKVPKDTSVSYFSFYKFYHIHLGMPLQLFEESQLSFLIKSGKLFISYTNAARLSITKKIFLRITRHQQTNDAKLNIKAVFKVT